MSGTGSWAQSGFGGVKVEQERQATANGPNRFWMPENSSKEFLFIDDEPTQIHEHNPKINGDFKNWLTCLQGISESATCCELLGPKSRYPVWYFTVVDLSKWTDKKGNVYQNEIKFFPAKLKTAQKFERKKKERGTLVGSIFRASRDGAKSSSVGDEFEFVREADLSKLFEHVVYKNKKLSELYARANTDADALHLLKKVFQLQIGENNSVVNKVVAFDYRSLLAPKTSAELKPMLRGATSGFDNDGPTGGSAAGGAGGAGAGASDDIPF